MEKIVEELTQVRSVRGTLLVGKDGLVIVSAGEFKHDTDFIGASICELFATAETMTFERFEAGKPVNITLESQDLIFIVYEVTEETILAVLAEKDANTGIINIEIKLALQKLQEMLI